MKVKDVIFEECTIFNELKLNFSPNINIITGLNGVGKTIVLKAIYSLTKTIENINTETYPGLRALMITGDCVSKVYSTKKQGQHLERINLRLSLYF